jgi:hypothetical protein
MSRCGADVRHGKHEFAADGKLPVDGRDRRSTSDATSHLSKFDFEAQCVSWPYLSFEPNAVNASEVGHLAFVFVRAEERDCTNLRQRFHD